MPARTAQVGYERATMPIARVMGGYFSMTGIIRSRRFLSTRKRLIMETVMNMDAMSIPSTAPSMNLSSIIFVYSGWIADTR